MKYDTYYFIYFTSLTLACLVEHRHDILAGTEEKLT